MVSVSRSIVVSMLGVASFAVTGVAEGYTFFEGRPEAVVTLSETSPGSNVYQFSEDYLWRDENGGGHSEEQLGSWASLTKGYRGYQHNDIGNTVLLEATGHHIEYEFIIPVDKSNLTDVAIEARMRGSSLVARVYDFENANWYSLHSLFGGGSSAWEVKSASVPTAALGGSIDGEVRLKLFLHQEGNGFGNGIDSLLITATAVPEPVGATVIGLGALALICRRRRVR